MKPKPIMDDADAVRAEAQEKARKLAEKWTVRLGGRHPRSYYNDTSQAIWDCRYELEHAFSLGAK